MRIAHGRRGHAASAIADPTVAVAFVLTTSFVLLCSCSEGEPAAPPPVEATWHGERGTVSMTVRAVPDEVMVGERVKLSVEVRAPEGVPVTMPLIKDELASFKVRAAHTPPDVPQEGMRAWTHSWELDTFAAGEAEIPAIAVKFGAPEEELASEPLKVLIRTVLADDQEPTNYRDIKAPVTLRDRYSLATALFIAIPLLLAMALAALLLARRRRRPAAVPIVPAHERALQDLARLEAEDLPGRGAVHEYYFRLADIVRGYLERRFEILAPERTTEEFLREARRDRSLSQAQKEMLGDFLRAADLVKFALHQPGPHEAAGAMEAARRFVNETAPQPDVVEAAA